MISIVTVCDDTTGALSANPSFFHGEKWESNLQDETTHFPNVTLDHPIVIRWDLGASGNLDGAPNLSVLFADKVATDARQAQVQPVIDAMYAMMKEFVLRLSADPRVKEIKNVNTIEVYRLKDLNVSGIYLMASVELEDLSAICLPKYLVDGDGKYIYSDTLNRIKIVL